MQGVRELNRLAREAKANREAHERRRARLQEEQEQAAMEAAERERLEMERKAEAEQKRRMKETVKDVVEELLSKQSGEILTLMNRKFAHISEEMRATKVTVERLEHAVNEQPTLTEFMDLLEDSRAKTHAIDLSDPPQKKALEDLFAASRSQPHAIDLSHAAPKKALEDLLAASRSDPHAINLPHPS